MDFGVDQLDIKKKMKPVLGPNVVLRLKLGPSTNAGPMGNKGYGVLTTKEDSNLEMVTVVLNDHPSQETTTKLNTDESVDSNRGLLYK